MNSLLPKIASVSDAANISSIPLCPLELFTPCKHSAVSLTKPCSATYMIHPCSLFPPIYAAAWASSRTCYNPLWYRLPAKHVCCSPSCVRQHLRNLVFYDSIILLKILNLATIRWEITECFVTYLAVSLSCSYSVSRFENSKLTLVSNSGEDIL